MKTIVTHMNPDLDAITCVWLLKRFGGQDWQEAEVKFIPAGSTYKGEKVDSNPDVLHLDVGLGKLDHHQYSNENLCAAKLTFQYLSSKFSQLAQDKALLRLIEVVREIDWAGYLHYPQSYHDRYSFLFFEHGIIGGWQGQYRNQSDKHLQWGLIVLDGIYQNLKAKVEAEKVLEQKGVTFKTCWGKGIGAETDVFGFVNFAQARGFPIVVAKNPKQGNVRIHAFEFGRMSSSPAKRGTASFLGSEKSEPSKVAIDLTGVWEILKHKDQDATWFLHASRKMVLNGSKANPEMVPTKLSLSQVIEVLKKA